MQAESWCWRHCSRWPYQRWPRRKIVDAAVDKKDKRNKKEKEDERKTSRTASWIASALSSLIAMTPAMDVETVRGLIVDRPLKDRRIDIETETGITLVAV